MILEDDAKMPACSCKVCVYLRSIDRHERKVLTGQEITRPLTDYEFIAQMYHQGYFKSEPSLNYSFKWFWDRIEKEPEAARIAIKKMMLEARRRGDVLNSTTKVKKGESE